MILQALAVCLVVGVADYLWAGWMIAVSERRAHLAARYSVAILLASGVLTLSLVESPLYLLPACVGGYIGTYLKVRL